ncbi:hypothetical protein, partial [Escherichia coli]|uniref:hypothetical protein n=1 Tax=Escherichia coli TaxID=562 RepID=UPI001AD94A4D
HAHKTSTRRETLEEHTHKSNRQNSYRIVRKNRQKIAAVFCESTLLYSPLGSPKKVPYKVTWAAYMPIP